MKVGDSMLFYRDEDSEPEAAIVAKVLEDGSLNLAVFDSSGSGSRGEHSIPVSTKKTKGAHCRAK